MRFRHLLSDCVRIAVVDSEYKAKRAITPLWAFITLSPSAMFSITEISIKDRIARLHYMAHEKSAHTHTHGSSNNKSIEYGEAHGQFECNKTVEYINKKEMSEKNAVSWSKQFFHNVSSARSFFFRCCCTRSALFFCVVPSIRLLYSFFPRGLCILSM